jgi:murein DD-endopeptidase MepM/ murein hydrolase activator NlpD
MVLLANPVPLSTESETPHRAPSESSNSGSTPAAIVRRDVHRHVRRLAGLATAVTAGFLSPQTASAVPNRTQTVPTPGVLSGVVSGVVVPAIGQTVNTQIIIPAVPQTSAVITPSIAARAALPISTGPTAIVEAGDLDEDGSAPSIQVTLGTETLEWKCPVPGAKFTNDWGQSRSGGRSHTGTDLLAPRGTPVLAPFAGTAVQKGSSRGGLSVYLNAPGGMQIFGAHLSSYGTAGKVKAGTVIGYVGNTGNASGAAPHLHIEIHPKKGAKTNPYPVMKKICG